TILTSAGTDDESPPGPGTPVERDRTAAADSKGRTARPPPRGKTGAGRLRVGRGRGLIFPEGTAPRTTGPARSVATGEGRALPDVTSPTSDRAARAAAADRADRRPGRRRTPETDAMHFDTPSQPADTAAQPGHDDRPWHRLLNGYQWFVFVVASLGWLFDTMDQQLFNLARLPAVAELLGTKVGVQQTAGMVKEYGGYATTIFMIGWATGGLIFGIMGDRLGRAR